MAILLAAVPIPLWDPVRLAEEMSVLDLISRGRVSYAFGVGHRSEEYDHFGIDMATRGRVADEMLAVLGPLVRGEVRRISGPPGSRHPAVRVARRADGADRRWQQGRRAACRHATAWGSSRRPTRPA